MRGGEILNSNNHREPFLILVRCGSIAPTSRSGGHFRSGGSQFRSRCRCFRVDRSIMVVGLLRFIYSIWQYRRALRSGGTSEARSRSLLAYISTLRWSREAACMVVKKGISQRQKGVSGGSSKLARLVARGITSTQYLMISQALNRGLNAGRTRPGIATS
jgi:hypothetical protein